MIDNVMGIILMAAISDDSLGESHLKNSYIYGETESPDCP